MSIKKIVAVLAFSTVAIGVAGSSFVANAQSSQNSQSSVSDNFQKAFGKRMKVGKDQMHENGENFGGEMGKGMKMGMRGGKMGKNFEELVAKYKIDSTLTENAKKAQTDAKTAVQNYMDAKKSKTGNLTELKTKMIEVQKAVKDAGQKVQTAVFEARINEAKTLGVDQTVIDNFVNNHKAQQDLRTQMETLRANDATTMGQIKELKTKIENSRDSGQSAHQAFQDAVKAKIK